MMNTTATDSNYFEVIFYENMTQTSYCIRDDKIFFSFSCFLFKLATDYNFAILTIIFFLIIFFDIFLNLIILISIINNKSRKRVDKCFMSNAFADLSMGLFVMPCTAISILFNHFPFGKYICFIWILLDFTFGTVSMLHIMFISYDRYLSVSKPLKYTQKTTTNDSQLTITRLPTSAIISIIWIVSVILWLPPIFYLKLQDLKSDVTLFDCTIKMNRFLIVPHSILVYFLPMLLILIFYSRTIRIVQLKIKRRRRQSILSSIKSKSSQDEEANGGFRKRFFSNKSNKTNASEVSNDNNPIDIESSVILKNFFSKLNYRLSLNENLNFGEYDTPNSNSVLTSSSLNRPSLIETPIKSDTSFNEGSYEDIGHSTSTLSSINETNDLCLKIIEQNEKLRMQFYLNESAKKSHQDLNKTAANKKINYLQVPRRQCISFSEDKVMGPTKSIKHRRKADSVNLSPIITNGRKSNQNTTNENKDMTSFLSLPNSSNDCNNVFLFPQDQSQSINNKGSGAVSSLIPNTLLISLQSSGFFANTKRETYLTYKLGIILVAFMFCWLPFSLCWTITSFCKTCISDKVYFLSFWLAYLNSIFTPFILLYTNTQYRRTIFYIRQCFGCCSSKSSGHTSNQQRKSTV